MWYWNPIDCNEGISGVHDISHCVEIDDDNHHFKTLPTPYGMTWASDKNNLPTLVDIPDIEPVEPNINLLSQ